MNLLLERETQIVTHEMYQFWAFMATRLDFIEFLQSSDH